ncbi:MAG: ABC transporter permease [Kofleriaceae bacterium]|nr:ABC transporter permease [Kofleriaceae bacterium]MCL4225364.1 ABC transporter permease [Myxococcales bacterium]
MWTLARKILLHDRIKFTVAAAGVSISVMLVLVQIGLYLGFMQNASNLIDHATADVWVTGEGSENFDFSAPIDERAFYRVASVPGVAHAERMLLAFGQFRLADGGTQGVQVVGLEPGGRLLRPWNVVAGDPAHIHQAGAIMVDVTEAAKLKLDRVGERREIFGVRAEVVGLTRGIRSFTTSPFVWTDLDSARAYALYPAERFNYVLVEAAPGVDPGDLARRLDQLPGLDAYTGPTMSARARHYWSSRTGVGAGFFTTAALGVIVGLVVVGQILYNGTLEHLKEYGTLKAMGARDGAILRVIVYQALISAAVGLVLGGGLALAARAAMAGANLNVLLTRDLVIVTAILTAVMCCLASLLSVIKVLRLDPASVFKG